MEPDSDVDDPVTDGGVSADLTQAELYTTVRTAVKDAMLDVLGTVFLLGLALLAAAAGIQAVLAAASSTGVAIGLAFLAIALVLAAAALDVLPPFRE